MAWLELSQLDRLRLEVEMPSKHVNRFSNYYRANARGKVLPAPGSDSFLIQENTHGIEYRIYFSCADDVVEEIRRRNYHVESNRRGSRADTHDHRVNSQALFECLIRRGAGLGDNT